MSGEQFGLKSCAWFQIWTSMQHEFNLKSQVWVLTKIAWHEVQLPLYYIHFEIAKIQNLVSSNIFLMQYWTGLKLNSSIFFWGGGKQVTVVVCFHQCLKTENIKIKIFAIFIKIIVKKNCNNLVNLNISFKKSLIHQHTFWKVLLTIGSFRQNIHAACRIVKEIRCWTRRDTPSRRRLKTIFKCSIVVKKCDLILSTSEIGQFPIRLTVIKENTCIC